MILNLVLGEGIRVESQNCYLGLCLCLGLRYGSGLKMRPIFARKLLNNTKIGVGWRNKVGIPKFVILFSVGVCG